jgi:hypothetical protein
LQSILGTSSCAYGLCVNANAPWIPNNWYFLIGAQDQPTFGRVYESPVVESCVVWQWCKLKTFQGILGIIFPVRKEKCRPTWIWKGCWEKILR